MMGVDVFVCLPTEACLAMPPPLPSPAPPREICLNIGKLLHGFPQNRPTSVTCHCLPEPHLQKTTTFRGPRLLPATLLAIVHTPAFCFPCILSCGSGCVLSWQLCPVAIFPRCSTYVTVCFAANHAEVRSSLRRTAWICSGRGGGWGA